MAIYRLSDRTPTIHDSVFVADTAAVIGNVHLAAHSSVWFGAVLRGDTEPLNIGEGCNIQDGAVLHTEKGFPLELDSHITVGHQAVLHGCSIGGGSLIGIQAVVLDGARIGRQSLVGAGAIVTSGKEFPDRALILGSPAKVVRMLSDEEVIKLQTNIYFYAEQRRPHFREKLLRID